MIDREPARDRVGEQRIGAADVVDAPVGAEQPGGVHDAAGIADKAAGDVDGRARLLDDVDRRRLEAAADGEDLVDRLRNGADIAFGVEQRRAHPPEAIGAGPALAGIDDHGLADQAFRQRIVGDLVGGDEDADLVGRHRQRDVEAAEIDGAAGLEQDGLSGGHRHRRARRLDQCAAPPCPVALHVNIAEGLDGDLRLEDCLEVRRRVVAVGRDRRVDGRGLQRPARLVRQDRRDARSPQHDIAGTGR